MSDQVTEPDDLLDLERWDLFRNFATGGEPSIRLDDWGLLRKCE